MTLRIPEPGEQLVGKYKLLSLLGEGGFARVFRAVDLRVQREVAIKFLLPGDDGGYEPALAARFVREAKLLATLHDPHTLQLFDFGQTPDGVYYMVSELLGGNDLSELLESRVLSPEETTHVLLQVLHSLREAHATGILHRDVKPSNIRVFHYDSDPLCVKLMDFGVARSLDDSAGGITKTGAHVGTLIYMSPEQLHGEKLTPASDLFSLGLTTFEMLTGTCKPARQAVFAARAIELQAPEPLRSAILKMLELAAEDRFQTAQQVIDLLTPYDSKPGRAISGSGPVLRAQSGSQSGQRRAHRPRDPSRGVSSQPAPQRPMPRWFVPTVVAVAVVVAGLAVAKLTLGKREAQPTVVQRTNPLASTTKLPPTPKTVVEDVVAPTPASPDAGHDAARPRLVGETAGCSAEYDGSGRPISKRFSIGIGVQRYVLYIPPKLESGEKVQLMVGFHTDTDGAGSFLRHLKDIADERGMVIAMPEGGDLNAWPDGFSASRLRRLVEDVSEAACIDPESVVLLGHGSGGVPAVELSCEPEVSAVVTTSYRRDAGVSMCTAPVPYLALNPNRSGHLPRGGGKNCTGTRTIISQTLETESWIDRNKCEGKTKTRRRDGLACETWPKCAAPLEVCDVDGGHNWPGTGKRFVDLIGCDGPKTEGDFSPTIVEFLERVHEPPK